MNVCTSYFDLKRSQSNIFLLVIYGTLNKRGERAISD